jgi:FKBP-type peptidyl-prolyl cis-trans isomerase FkpA
MKKYFLYILLTVLAVKANAQDGFKSGTNGVTYKILTPNTGEKIKIGDVVTFHVTQKTDKDSVLISTYQTGTPAKVQVQATGDMMDIFPLLAVNDSVIVRVPTDTIFKGHDDQRPPFFPKGSRLVIIVKVLKIQTLDDAMAEKQAESLKLEAAQATLADKFIADNKLSVLATPSGLRYSVSKLGTGTKPVMGDTVYVNYVGHTLDGKVFDSSIEAEAKKAGLQQPGREYAPLSFALGTQGIIEGWNEAFPLLNAGTKATLILPSKLAYKENSPGPGIPPYSTLIFDIELIKIKKPGQATTSAPAKAPGKKTAITKKPAVKKPAATAKKKQ